LSSESCNGTSSTALVASDDESDDEAEESVDDDGTNEDENEKDCIGEVVVERAPSSSSAITKEG
jgi:hypothetical protein